MNSSSCFYRRGGDALSGKCCRDLHTTQDQEAHKVKVGLPLQHLLNQQGSASLCFRTRNNQAERRLMAAPPSHCCNRPQHQNLYQKNQKRNSPWYHQNLIQTIPFLQDLPKGEKKILILNCSGYQISVKFEIRKHQHQLLYKQLNVLDNLHKLMGRVRWQQRETSWKWAYRRNQSRKKSNKSWKTKLWIQWHQTWFNSLYTCPVHMQHIHMDGVWGRQLEIIFFIKEEVRAEELFMVDEAYSRLGSFYLAIIYTCWEPAATTSHPWLHPC